MIIAHLALLETLGSHLETLDNFLWGYAVLPALLVLGVYLTYTSRFVQFRRFPHILKTFFHSLTKKHTGDGVHPLKAFFVCIGGCMGVSNVVAVCTATQLGGPGALFWIWITALVGMILKYSEVYLGMLHRVPHGKGGYRGGPMFFLQKAFKQPWVPKVVCLLLCIYGVEIYQFVVVTETLSTNFELNKYLIAFALITLIIAMSRRGVHHIGRIASVLIPVFIVCYLGMGLWILMQNIHLVPKIMQTVMQSAFTGHAAVGAFAGSTILLTASQGIRRSCYSGDVAVGYASVIHSETREVSPEKQASLAIMEVFLDSFVICTTSVMLVLTTGVWDKPIEASMLVQHALAQYFPGMHIFMPLFLLLLGFTTIISYFCAGIKCAEFISPKIGRKLYYFYGSGICMLFVCLQTSHALTIMSITAAFLLMMNLCGIFKLRHQIHFHLPHQRQAGLVQPEPVLAVEAQPEVS